MSGTPASSSNLVSRLPTATSFQRRFSHPSKNSSSPSFSREETSYEQAARFNRQAVDLLHLATKDGKPELDSALYEVMTLLYNALASLQESLEQTTYHSTQHFNNATKTRAQVDSSMIALIASAMESETTSPLPQSTRTRDRIERQESLLHGNPARSIPLRSAIFSQESVPFMRRIQLPKFPIPYYMYPCAFYFIERSSRPSSALPAAIDAETAAIGGSIILYNIAFVHHFECLLHNSPVELQNKVLLHYMNCGLLLNACVWIGGEIRQQAMNLSIAFVNNACQIHASQRSNSLNFVYLLHVLQIMIGYANQVHSASFHSMFLERDLIGFAMNHATLARGDSPVHPVMAQAA